MSEENTRIRCEKCGALYSEGTKTCRSCGSTLKTLKEQTDDEILHGMPLQDWRAFIGKNSYYYIESYKKNRDKDFFLSFNPAAGFFGIVWVFYRKMYKFGFALMALMLVLSLMVSFIVIGARTPEIRQAKQEFSKYTEYMTYDGKKTENYPETESELAKEIQDEYWSYSQVVTSVKNAAIFLGTITSFFIVMVLMLFCSEFVYREHILNRTVRRKGYSATSGEGGTSLFAAMLIYYVYESVSVFIAYTLIGVVEAIL